MVISQSALQLLVVFSHTHLSLIQPGSSPTTSQRVLGSCRQRQGRRRKGLGPDSRQTRPSRFCQSRDNIPSTHGSEMKIAGYILFALAVAFHIWTIRTISQLVRETNNLGTGVRFSHFLWTPAWKVHRAAIPSSPLRRRIIVRFLLTWATATLAMLCIAYATVHSSGWPGR
jgi:hypothetical protein